MKKLLFLGLLSVAVLSSFATESQAWFDCCRCRRCCRCSTKLCITPYNAFSPVMCGNIVANGCMPFNFCGGCPPMGPSCFAPSYGGCCTSGCCTSGGENGCLPSPGSFANVQPTQGVPGQPLPQGQPGGQFTPPNPQPLSQSFYPAYGYGYGPVQPVGYMQGYQPMYAPAYQYGYGMPYQSPGYWYGY
jgi:hypothetical protein